MATEDVHEAVVRVEGLSTRIGDRWVHRDLNLTARPGEILAVVGSSGSGKSLLLQQITGLLTPTEGRVEVLGVDVHRADEEVLRRLRLRWGILFQRDALFSAFTVFDNVAFPLRELNRYGHHLDQTLIADLVWSRLAMVGLDPEDAWKMPAELSGGMAKRAALARALVLEAEVLMLDEPTAGLDPMLARDLTDLIRNIHREHRFSALVISHELDTIIALADRLALLDSGRIVAIGTPEQVAALDHPFVARLFALSEARERLARLAATEP